MRAEIAGDDGPQVYGRIIVAPCQMQVLTNFRGLIEGGAPRKLVVQRLKPFQGSHATWDSAAYRAADSSGVLVHMPRDLLSDLSLFYEMMSSLNTYSEREASSLAHLRALPATGGAISAAERASLLTAVEEELGNVKQIRSDSLFAARAMYRSGVKLDRGGQSYVDQGLPLGKQPEFAACVAKGLSDLARANSKSSTSRYFITPDDEVAAPGTPKK
jgi:hypothetical protein